jgi:hypothetical protein
VSTEESGREGNKIKTNKKRKNERTTSLNNKNIRETW